jgi:hypothetical protein
VDVIVIDLIIGHQLFKDASDWLETEDLRGRVHRLRRQRIDARIGPDIQDNLRALTQV